MDEIIVEMFVTMINKVLINSVHLINGWSRWGHEQTSFIYSKKVTMESINRQKAQLQTKTSFLVPDATKINQNTFSNEAINVKNTYICQVEQWVENSVEHLFQALNYKSKSSYLLCMCDFIMILDRSLIIGWRKHSGKPEMVSSVFTSVSFCAMG